MNTNAKLDCKYGKDGITLIVENCKIASKHEDFERFCAWYLNKRLADRPPATNPMDEAVMTQISKILITNKGKLK